MEGLRHRDWHLIAEQRFRRRALLEVVAQQFRGQPHIVIADRIGGQYLRLDARARLLWDRLDGRRSMQDLWRDLAALPVGIGPGQTELMSWVLQLSSAGLILSDHDMDPAHLAHRLRKRRDQAVTGRVMSPLAIRVPLFDPGPLLRRIYPLARPLFTGTGAVVFALLMLAGLISGVLNAGALAGSSGALLLSQSGLLAMVIAYPVMKALHELGHGLVLHHYGGEVREAGVMLLLFFPLPYVDASAAAAIPSHRARMMVGAAGVIVELAMAAAALLLWLRAEPGLLQAVLQSFVLMGTLSTLAFNGNPLLKFDAYYVLSDYLQIPNLAQRAGAFVQDRFLARLLSLRPQEVAGPGEAPILMAYGLAALVYRLLLTFVIVAIVSQLFFALGLLLAAWSFISAVVLPLWKLVKKGREMVQAQAAGRRAGGRIALVMAVVLALVALVPLPFSATGEGQVIALSQTEIRADAAGFVAAPEEGRHPPGEGAWVAEGEVVLHLQNPELESRLSIARLARAQVDVTLSAAGLSVADRRIALAQRESLSGNIARLETLAEAQSLRAPAAGRISWHGGQPPVPGSYLDRGSRPGRIAAPGGQEVVAALPAHFAGVLPADGAGLSLRMRDGRRFEGQISGRRVLAQGDEVPEALLTRRGGSVAESNLAPGQALAPVIALWARTPSDLSAALGQRVEVRIALPPRPALQQLIFHLDRLFLRITRV